jgi:hypothetical protein
MMVRTKAFYGVNPISLPNPHKIMLYAPKLMNHDITIDLHKKFVPCA